MSHSVHDAADVPGAAKLSSAGTWDAVFRSPARETLEAALPAYVAPRRWFGAKARTIHAIRIQEAIPILPAAVLALLRVEYAEGAPDLYALPIGFLAEPASQAMQAERPAAVIAALRAGDEDGVLYDAVWDPAFCTALLEAIDEQRQYAGISGDVSATASSALAQLRGADIASLPPVLLGVEQSNTSIRYGERFILKLYRRLEAGINPDQEIGLFLTERAAFANVPPVAGVLEFRPHPSAEGEPVTLALLQGFVPNRGDAWHHTLDALADYYRTAQQQLGLTGCALALPPGPLLDLVRDPLPAQAERLIGPYVDSARLLGRRTAELHLALASDPEQPAFAPEPFTPEFQAYLQRSMRELVDHNMQLLRARFVTLPESGKDDARQVLAREAEIAGRFDALLGRPIRALRTRIHGDYHLGQVLYTGNDFMIIDFEGEPARPLSERRMKRSPLQDVAGMLRSFHYAAYAAYFAQEQDGRPATELEPWARLWHLWVSVAYLQSYLAVADGATFIPDEPEDLKLLLDVYLVEKAVYELGYELNNRPGWVQIPLQGILQTMQAGMKEGAVLPEEGRNRVIIESVTPAIDGGRFPIKRIVGDETTVEAVALTDGHDALSCAVIYRKEDAAEWTEVPMVFLINDRWQATFTVQELGVYKYTVQGWVDHFKTWVRDFAKRVQAGQDVTVDLQIGAQLVEAAAAQATGAVKDTLATYAHALNAGGDEGTRQALSDELAQLMARHGVRQFITTYRQELTIVVDRARARFGAWYELFPRSTAPVPGQHGTFRDVEARLPYVASMGFDVLYLPPIHPIGTAFRKGRNNTTTPAPDDPGSPWAIGSAEGGHKSIHPQLGTLDDFRHLMSAAAAHGLEIAMDIAFQCSPDHPYVKEHPQWFRQRPDGTIQYAENPPKKYQDIYPFDFETEDWRALWEELKSIFDFWIAQGVRIFRVDNPHTKPFAFWEWLITEVKRETPDAIFLAEAFTRPAALYGLAKRGFTQSYNYFPWRNTKWELTQYLTELTQTEVKDFCGPNLWPNTPDILTEYLQYGGRAAHITRLVLAATLGPSYGIYGAAFELCENRPLAPGREEYLDSEKYEIKAWDIHRPDSLRGLIGRVNQIRHENPAFHANRNLRFHDIDNDQLIAFTKTNADRTNEVLVVVNLDPRYRQSGFIHLPLEDLGLDQHQPFQVHDLLTDARYIWHGPHNYIELDPRHLPAHIFVIRRRVRTEHDFDYYL